MYSLFSSSILLGVLIKIAEQSLPNRENYPLKSARQLAKIDLK
jgi:hypothetical protein